MGLPVSPIADTSAAGSDAAAADAATVAADAAARAGVEIRGLDAAATRQAEDLLAAIWRAPPGVVPISSDLLRALRHTGNYVAGAYVQTRLVGVSVAFFTGDRAARLHSHISGVAPGMQGRSVGFALKLHQRAWALANGVAQVTWTVDPLVRRNAFFNLAKLSARVVAYLPDFYGTMTDGLNAHDQSDRLSLAWSLLDERVVAACQGVRAVVEAAEDECSPLLAVGAGDRPVVGAPAGALLSCRLPEDIVGVRASDPDLARSWRLALRDTLGTALHDGYRVVGVTRDGGYLLSREPDR